MENLVFATELLAIALVGGLFVIVPALSRRDLYFSVHVDPAFPASDEGRAIRRGYMALAGAGAVVALAIGALLFVTRAPLLLPAAYLVLVACGTGAFVRANRATRPFGLPVSTVREASLRKRNVSLPAGPLAWSGPLVTLLLTTAYVALSWSSLPDAFPIHWNAQGVPDGFAAKSAASVFFVLAVGLVVTLMLVVSAWFIARAPARASSNEAAAQWSALNRKVTTYTLLAASYFSAVLCSVLGVFPLLGPEPRRITTLLLVIGSPMFTLGVIGAIASVMMKRPAMTEAAPERAPNDAYKLGGLFYSNPADPAVWVEKRMGIGYTLNYAHRSAWVITAVMVIVPLAIAGFGLVAAAMGVASATHR